METVSDLTEEIEDILQEESYEASISNVKILKYLNRGLRYIASRLYLPSLEESDSIDTDNGNNFVQLPDDFHRNIFYCRSEQYYVDIPIYETKSNLFRQFSQLDLSGRVVGVATSGRYLYYQRIPSDSETLSIQYFRLPDDLETDSDSPSCLISGFEEPLLVNWVCWQLFSRVEDASIGDRKVNTAYHKDLFDKYLAEMEEAIGPLAVDGNRIPQPIPTEINWNVIYGD